MLTAYPETVDYSESIIQKDLAQDINILYNSIASTSTYNDYDYTLLDILNDADGHLDTVDVGNTTAIYDTDNYSNGGSGNTSDAAEDIGTYGSYTTIKTLDLDDVTVASLGITNQIREHVGGNPTSCRMKYNYTDTSVEYSAVNTQSTQVYTAKSYTNPSPTKPIDSVEVQMLSNSGREKLTSCDWAITPSDVITQTTMVTIPAGVKATQLFCHNSLAGTGSVTYDLSLDNDVSSTDDLVLNERNDMASSDGTQLILKIKLNGTGTGNTASVSDYGLLLYY